ncbi:cytochrome c oxidase assembly protein [Curtobacterium sp. MCBD17_013]|uniref:cytochrome c oxidase assembly protein n=1 Tax=Curtobacterium sp. MCBD17_013 TaxID=2175668 RepID=UPI000DA9C381|nr:cytochrome c oxidase assembly protein [Curtobacterium sp. MCBD17_013]PZF58060.1 cytochrome c oxidase assembly protein [Curtobacterium sp. MCBD17_013]
MLVVAAVAYGRWLVIARRRGHQWSAARVLGFVAALVLFAVLQFGITGVYDRELRWAFVLRLALLLIAVPTFAALGGPLTLVRLAGSEQSVRVVDGLLHSRAVRLLGNAIVSPLVALAVFAVLLTPLAATIRTSGVWEVVITVFVPMLGFALVAPISEPGVLRSTTFLTAEFLLAFVELLLDAVPGVVMRITNHVMDHAGVGLVGPSWAPSALQDQHLAADLLWFIAEVGDIPILIALFIRWQRTDRREARSIDELSDEEVEAMTREHLDRFRRQA